MTNAAPPTLRPADLADGAALDLDADGVPTAPFAPVELAGSAPRDVLEAATRAARSSARVLVGVSDGCPHESWAPLLEALTCTVVNAPSHDGLPPTCVAVDDVAAASVHIGEQVRRSPRAGSTLVQLLRLTSRLDVGDGLVAESLAYSTLLAGPEFAAWLADRRRGDDAAPPDPVVLVDRAGTVLTVTLNRPERHNAYGYLVRDGLVEALALAVWDDSVSRVVLRGAGRSFCSGGDLDEFGTAPDVATAHVIRTHRSVATLLHGLGDRAEAHVHGACIGAGTELAAFCGTVVARDDAFFQLPELSMGLVPGAGGTVSVCRRIGRWRTAYLALSGCRIDVDTALVWRLVDRRADS